MKRFVRIINAVDFYNEKFIPKYPYYEVIYAHEKFAAIGIEGMILYKMNWEDIEDFNF